MRLIKGKPILTVGGKKTAPKIAFLQRGLILEKTEEILYVHTSLLDYCFGEINRPKTQVFSSLSGRNNAIEMTIIINKLLFFTPF